MADFGSLVTNLGFPIAVAVYLLVERKSSTDNYLKLLERYRTDSISQASLLERAVDVLNRGSRKA